MAQWIYQFSPGDRPELATDEDAWTPDDEKVAAAHVARIVGATDAGIVILAGRSQDGIGPAVVIFEMESEAEARAFMKEDPFVSEGLFGATLHPFHAAFMRSRE